MTLTILGTLLAIGLGWRIWRQGGLLTSLLALVLGVLVAMIGGPFANGIRTVINIVRTVFAWLAGLIF